MSDLDADDELLSYATDDALSLEDLGRTYAQLIGSCDPDTVRERPEMDGRRPASREAFGTRVPEAGSRNETGGSAELVSQGFTTSELERLVAEGEAKLAGRHGVDVGSPARSDSNADAASGLPVTPQRVLEAVLFVGDQDGLGLTPSDIAALMRGVSVREVHSYVEHLNLEYAANEHCFRIELHGNKYRLVLAPQATASLERLKGRLRETRLSGLAIDCLSVIAYRPGITANEIDKMLNQPCGTQLNQLVRRHLLVFQPSANGRGQAGRYFPADRLLQVLGLTDWSELPVLEEE